MLSLQVGVGQICCTCGKVTLTNFASWEAVFEYVDNLHAFPPIVIQRDLVVTTVPINLIPT
jgi:hypothetical protein